MEMKEVVMKLVGPIKPIGDSSVDEIRYRNLRQLLSLAEELLSDVGSIIGENAGRPEASIKRAVKECIAFQRDVGIDTSSEGPGRE